MTWLAVLRQNQPTTRAAATSRLVFPSQMTCVPNGLHSTKKVIAATCSVVGRRARPHSEKVATTIAPAAGRLHTVTTTSAEREGSSARPSVKGAKCGG